MRLGKRRLLKQVQNAKRRHCLFINRPSLSFVSFSSVYKHLHSLAREALFYADEFPFLPIIFKPKPYSSNNGLKFSFNRSSGSSSAVIRKLVDHSIRAIFLCGIVVSSGSSEKAVDVAVIPSPHAGKPSIVPTTRTTIHIPS